MKPAPTEPRDGASDAEAGGTGLPGFRTWRGVYVFVVGCFAAYVLLLAAFTRYFAP